MTDTCATGTMRLPLVLGMLATFVASPAIAHEEKLPALIQASQPGDYFLAARLQGRLHLDDAGCLRVAGRNGDPGPFVIWSHGSRVERAEDGRIRVTDGHNGKTAEIGDEVVMGGGVMTKVPARGLAEPVPAACASGTFLITSVLSEVVAASDASPEPSRFGSATRPEAARPAGVPEDYVAEIPAHEREPDTGPLAAALQERFRDRIAGIYIEREPDFHVVVRLTGDRDGGTLQYRLGDDRVRVEVRTGAPHTLEELRAVLAGNRKTIDRLLPTAHGRFVDERTGEIEIAVDHGDVRSLARGGELASELGVPVRIVESERAVAQPGVAPREGRVVPTASPSGGWSPTCVQDLSEFDFYEGSPQKFHFGTREEVSGAYRLLVEAVGDPRWYAKPTLFYVTGAYTQFTRAECAGDKCDAMDVLTGLQQCSYGAQSAADTCYPIAAAYRSQLYCLLEPSLEEFDADNPFRPFE